MAGNSTSGGDGLLRIWRNIKLGPKLIILSLILIALAGAVGALGLRGFSEMSTATVNATNAAKLTEYSLLIRRSEKDFQLRKDHKYVDMVRQAIDDASVHIAKSLETSSKEGSAMLKDIQAEVKNYAKSMNIQEEVVAMCPTHCMSFDGSSLKINDKDCNRCMNCINRMPKALRPGKEKGATIMLGGKAPIVTGALMSWVMEIGRAHV